MGDQKHYCTNIAHFPINKFLQIGKNQGKYILIVGESPANIEIFNKLSNELKLFL